jgi:3-phosphoshikimate 1-carboxyvinyltransferase
MLSALLMVAPLAREITSIKLLAQVREPFVKLTLAMMAQFGVSHKNSQADFQILAQEKYRFGAQTYGIRIYPIEPDATAASYFAALPVVTHGSLLIGNLNPKLGMIQGDTQFFNVLARIGAEEKTIDSDFHVGLSAPSKRLGITQDFREFSDTFLTLAAIAPLLDGPTKITGIAHTRKQETDRVAGMARELKKLGQHVIESEDSLEIHPRPLTPGIEIETHNDHRFAMSFAILGCHDLLGNGQPWLTIKNPSCCAKTFPNFFELLENVRQQSLPR